MKNMNVKLAVILVLFFFTFLSIDSAVFAEGIELISAREKTDAKELYEEELISAQELIAVYNFIKMAQENGYTKEQATLLLMKQLEEIKDDVPELDWKRVTLRIACLGAGLGLIAVTAWAYYKYIQAQAIQSYTNMRNCSVDQVRRREEARDQDFPPFMRP